MSAASRGVWVVLPTYDEAENLGPISAAILAALPEATLLVVDDASPDGTGRLADGLAAADPRIRVRHRAAKQGSAGPTSTGSASPSTAVRDRRPDGRRLVATTRRRCPRSSPRSSADRADLVIGSRYTPGGGVVDWGIGRRLISRGGSLFARIVLGLSPERPDRRLQGLAGRDARRPSRSTASTPAATSSRSR